MTTKKHGANPSSDIQMPDFSHLMVTAMDQLSNAVVVTEADLELPGPKIIYANAAACRLSGYSAEELLGKTPRIFQGPKTDRKVLDDLKSKLKAGKVFKGKTTNYQKNGSEYVLDWTISPVRNAAGEITHFVSTQNDLTVEEQYLDKIKEHESFLEKIGSLAKVGGWRYDKNSGLVYWTDQVYEIHGMDSDQEIDIDTALSFFAEEDRVQLKEALEKCLERGVPYDLELKIRDRKGLKKWVRAEGLPVREEGRITGAWGVCQDITDSKQKADELGKALLDAKLANEAKSQFLMMMSHELRTPLNPILGLAEMLAEDADDPEQRASLELIASSAAKLASIIEDILDVSGLEPEGIKLNEQPFPVVERLRELVESFRQKAEAKHLDLTFNHPDQARAEPPLICWGDTRKIQQILVNLLSNALKFTHSGGICVDLLSPVFREDEVTIHIRISDTGIGIEPGKLETIFSPFYQIDMGSTRNYGGQGLGLHLSREIAKAMGGTITGSSQPGEGSVFELSLNLGIAAPGEPGQAQAVAPSKKSFDELSVLVAEDEHANRFAISKLLAMLKISHELVEDGEQVLQAVAEKDFDLILMDIRMPGLSGIEATCKIRAGGCGRSDVPIVALSAYVTDKVKSEALEAGMDGFLEKPINLPKLKSSLEDILSLTC